MKTSPEALALREKRNAAIRAAYDELNRQQKWSQSEIYAQLSDRTKLSRITSNHCFFVKKDCCIFASDSTKKRLRNLNINHKNLRQ